MVVVVGCPELTEDDVIALYTLVLIANVRPLLAVIFPSLDFR